MRQILFHIPLSSLWDRLPDIPIYGYGMMLFLAFLFCSWLAARLGMRYGMRPALFSDMALWLFVAGILGGRLLFVWQERDKFAGLPWWRVFAVWDGGLVFFGAVFGGTIGYLLFWFVVLRKEGVSNWQMADVIAPCLALGSCLGRVGCLLTGCCYGAVACPDCPAIHFPTTAPAFTDYLYPQRFQTPLDIVLDRAGAVVSVRPGSPADEAGVRVGDRIVKINDQDFVAPIDPNATLTDLITHGLKSGESYVTLTVVRGPDGVPQTLPPFPAETLGVHPTQVYETVSMALLLVLLLAYFPLRRPEGSVMVLYMLGYGVHRYLNEQLRADNPPEAFGLTFSQLVSIGLIVGAVVLAGFVWTRRPGGTVASDTPAAPSEPTTIQPSPPGG